MTENTHFYRKGKARVPSSDLEGTCMDYKPHWVSNFLNSRAAAHIMGDFGNFSGDSGSDFAEWSVGREDLIKNLCKIRKVSISYV